MPAPMVPIALVITLAGLLAIFRHVRSGREHAPAVLAALPLAVLLAVAPIPVESYRSVTAFRTAAETGHGGVHMVVAFGTAFSRALLTGALGFMVALVAAAGMERLAPQLAVGAPAGSTGAEGTMAQAPVRPRWPGVILAAGALLLLPAAALCSVMATGVPLVVDRWVALDAPNPPATPAVGDLAALSRTIANRLVLGTFGGAVLAFMSTVAAAATIAAHRFSSPSVGLSRLARGVLALGLLAGSLFTLAMSWQLWSIARLQAP